MLFPTQNKAFLIGISQYSDHVLKGVSHDLTLLTNSLRQYGYAADDIYCFSQPYQTLADLHRILKQLRRSVKRGTCLLYVGASGVLSLNPLQGGILPSDGQEDDLKTALSWSTLNAYLPVHPDIQVTVIIDT